MYKVTEITTFFQQSLKLLHYSYINAFIWSLKLSMFELSSLSLMMKRMLCVTNALELENRSYQQLLITVLKLRYDAFLVKRHVVKMRNVRCNPKAIKVISRCNYIYCTLWKSFVNLQNIYDNVFFQSDYDFSLNCKNEIT